MLVKTNVGRNFFGPNSISYDLSVLSCSSLLTAALNNNNTEFVWWWVGGFQPIIRSDQLLLSYGWVGFWQLHFSWSLSELSPSQKPEWGTHSTRNPSSWYFLYELLLFQMSASDSLFWHLDLFWFCSIISTHSIEEGRDLAEDQDRLLDIDNLDKYQKTARKNTPGTRGVPGVRDRTLAMKRGKRPKNHFFFLVKN